MVRINRQRASLPPFTDCYEQAARRVGHLGPWASAGVDSLTFKSSVHPGEAYVIALGAEAS